LVKPPNCPGNGSTSLSAGLKTVFIAFVFSAEYVQLVGAGDAVAGLVGIEGGVVSGVFNLESSGVEAPDWRPRHDKQYHEA